MISLYEHMMCMNSLDHQGCGWRETGIKVRRGIVARGLEWNAWRGEYFICWDVGRGEYSILECLER